MPMAKHGASLNGGMASERDVMEFWSKQPFDLELKQHEGNCDLCFLKGRNKLLSIIRDNPDLVHWWAEAEEEAEARASKPDGAKFNKEFTYKSLVETVRSSPLLPIWDNDAEFDAECGLWCAGS